MEILKSRTICEYLRINNAINWLSKIIAFDELHEIINFSIRAVSGAISGLSHIFCGIKNFPKNKIMSIINISTGVLELSKVGIDAIITYKKYEGEEASKKLTKAQDNFLSLLNQIDILFSELIDSNLEQLKKNNIIILGIDQSDSIYNEGTDLQIYNINNIDNYAKCLSENEKDRTKYIENMIYFYQNIIPTLSELTDKGENHKKTSLDFFLSFQEFIIKNCNNKDFWIKISKENIAKFIDYMKKKYNNGENYFKNNSNEIKNKFIQSLGESKIKKNKTFNIEKPLYNREGFEPPAPIIDYKNSQLKTSRKYIKEGLKY